MVSNNPGRRHNRIYLFIGGFLTLFFVQLSHIAISQDQFPKGYFLFPFNPGKTNFLSANMGELRPNHFHGGLDVKTAAQIGFPILASADGYVSRIKVSSYGYGNVIYIDHPNNFVTVYAHLDKFNKEIAAYVRKKQYEKESFDIELFPTETELLVKKGDVIGISGNSGSSGGPHLHYEIRDKANKMYNPLLFGFTEIKDNISPVFEKIAIRTFGQDSRVNEEFGRTEFPCIRQSTKYTIATPITATGEIGIEIKAHDKMNNTQNKYGITCIEMSVDGKETFYHSLKSLSFDENKYINVHIDFETYMNKGVRYEKTYVSDGNNLSTYKKGDHNGKLYIKDTLTHKVQIIIYDAHNNQSTLVFNVKGKALTAPQKSLIKPKVVPEIKSDLYENILKIKGYPDTSLSARLFTKTFSIKMKPDQYEDGLAVYLYDLRKGLPDSVIIGNKSRQFNYISAIPSGLDFNVSKPGFKMNFTKESLFDTLYLQYSHTISPSGVEAFLVGDATIPFLKQPEINITPKDITPDTTQVNIYTVAKNPRFEGGIWKNGTVKFSPKSLGKFSFYRDDDKPVIKFINQIGNSVRFTVSDKLSGIQSFRATLNGKWVLMNYDHKRSLLWSELEEDVILKGSFQLEVIDRAGNKNTFIKEIL